MFKASLFVLCAIVARATCAGDFYVDETQDRPSRVRANDNVGPPAPYSFTYGSSDKYGTHGREESRDEHGTVRGSYRIALADGRMRVVKYVADKDGFRAGISTNEQGTESASSSGVVIHSEALPGPEAARAAHRSMARAGGSRHSAPRRAAAAASSNVEQWAPAPSRLRAPSYLPAERGEVVYYEP
uniref:Cuticular protein n=1 Tax=Rhipicephalus zambeziensis TaxID=60191 RepID=A0A224YUZ3_9ACAR